jgi:hypothetical protein
LKRQRRRVVPGTTHAAGRGYLWPAAPLLAWTLLASGPRQLLCDALHEALQQPGTRDQLAVDD